MKIVLLFTLAAVLISSSALPASAKKKATRTSNPGKADIQAATCLQVFLDRANLRLGKIGGRYNDVTRKALALFRESRGEQPQTRPPQPRAKSNVAHDAAAAKSLWRDVDRA